ncbi:putative beta-lysine N-acetyltransferase [Lihuaxuella thermophila]|nr:putative beta-lysine N-acetyltransferase [Lihuaxuella thermophila]
MNVAVKQMESGNDFTMEVCLDAPNKRLRVDDYRGNTRSIMKRIEELARRYSFTKVFVKSRQEDWQSFLAGGYILEGVFKGYFNGSDAYSMALYFDHERRTSDYWLEEDAILKEVQALPLKPDIPELPKGYHKRPGTIDDAGQLASLYGKVFQTYPTPMNREEYVKKVMEEGTLFYVIEQEGQIVSAASAEVNTVYHHAEMTDCATLPEHRKHGFMKILIHALEAELIQRKIFCAYSLARSLSFGMNAVFHQLGYEYAGRLIKNCNIYDKFEDMSLWVKKLA